MIADVTLDLSFYWPSLGEFIWEMAFFGLGIILGYIIRDMKKVKNEINRC